MKLAARFEEADQLPRVQQLIRVMQPRCSFIKLKLNNIGKELQ